MLKLTALFSCNLLSGFGNPEKFIQGMDNNTAPNGLGRVNYIGTVVEIKDPVRHI